MVIGAIKDIFSRQIFGKKEKSSAENFRETEEMKQAEEIKKEADRLAQLKQYKASIEEYNKAHALYPFKGNEEELFPNAADFLFKLNYNIAACYSYLGDFENSIKYFDNALGIQISSDENKVKALMGKGNIFYRKKMLVEGRHKAGAYRIPMETDWEIDDSRIDDFRKEDGKKSLIKQAHHCFTKATELDRSNVDGWYNKGYMEFLMGMVKESVQSFDTVIELNKNYENKEGI
ncbi:tetratricopeptide repeat protein [Candidatus Woesearchaeota archaeon]|nr:tetratricopeptide repeat protein [Candidatus Woesearchaeota archaeon]